MVLLNDPDEFKFKIHKFYITYFTETRIAEGVVSSPCVLL